MGGQETLLLVARFPRLLAGAAAFDPPTDMSRRYRDFASLKDGRELRRLAREEIGGTPTQRPACLRGAEPGPLRRADRAVGGAAAALLELARPDHHRPARRGGRARRRDSRAQSARSALGLRGGVGAHGGDASPTGGCRARSRGSTCCRGRRCRRCRAGRLSAGRGCSPDERSFEVGEQIVARLDADREANEVRRRRERLAGGRRVRHPGRLLDQALDAAERLGELEELRARDERRRPPASDSTRNETMPPKSRIWRRATSCDGWDARPG